MRTRHLSPRTEQAYVSWIRRFILFHGKRHPDDMGEAEVTAFLSSLATDRGVSASTQNQALSAILILYVEVLRRDLVWLDRVVRARRPTRVPVVLSRVEVEAILARLTGDRWLMASLMYGSGLRVAECAALRVKDVDLERGEIVVRDGKGRRDRRTVLPVTLQAPLAAHLARVKQQHHTDRRAGRGSVALPDALRTKYPQAPWEWAWQWVFPATRFYVDRTTGERRRHHLHPSVVQRAVKDAVRGAGIPKHASSHSLRHYAGFRTMPSDGKVESESPEIAPPNGKCGS